jgi:hypothetical protein
MERRPFLALASVATLPLTAGCLGTDESPTTETANETENNSRDDNSSDHSGGEPLFSDSFSATSKSGFLAIDEAVDTRAQAREAGYVLSGTDKTLSLEASVADDGTWESTDVSFPPIETFGIEATISVPEGLSGELTEQRMTASGTLAVSIEDFDDEFEFTVEATTAQSNALTGETNFAADPQTATLVDNEFVIDDSTSNSFINSQLGLPAEEPGTNWFELKIELSG